MSFFWPTAPNLEAGTLGAFGRLLHWVSVAFALLLVWAMARAGGQFSGESLKAGLLVAVPIALVGRGVRYVLARE